MGILLKKKKKAASPCFLLSSSHDCSLYAMSVVFPHFWRPTQLQYDLILTNYVYDPISK